MPDKPAREPGWDLPRHPVHGAPWDAYYAAMGRFVQMFGRVEAELHRVLKGMIFDLTTEEAGRLHWEILEAITGPMRVAPLKESIKRLLRVSDYDAGFSAEFDYAFNQLGEIHFFRDRVMHHGVHEFSKSEFYTSNDETVREGIQEEMLIFDVEMVLDMACDLVCLRDYFDALDDGFLRTKSDDPDWPQWLAEHKPTWRYKPSSLRRAGPKHWTSPQKQKPPQPPSQG